MNRKNTRASGTGAVAEEEGTSGEPGSTYYTLFPGTARPLQAVDCTAQLQMDGIGLSRQK